MNWTEVDQIWGDYYMPIILGLLLLVVFIVKRYDLIGRIKARQKYHVPKDELYDYPPDLPAPPKPPAFIQKQYSPHLFGGALSLSESLKIQKDNAEQELDGIKDRGKELLEREKDAISEFEKEKKKIEEEKQKLGMEHKYWFEQWKMVTKMIESNKEYEKVKH